MKENIDLKFKSAHAQKESVVSGKALLNTNGIIVGINPIFENMLKYKHKNYIIGLHIMTLITYMDDLYNSITCSRKSISPKTERCPDYNIIAKCKCMDGTNLKVILRMHALDKEYVICILYIT